MIDARKMDALLMEDELVALRKLLSENMHSNTTSDDLRKAFKISVEKEQMELHATRQHHLRSYIMLVSRLCKMDHTFEVPRLRCIIDNDTTQSR